MEHRATGFGQYITVNDLLEYSRLGPPSGYSQGSTAYDEANERPLAETKAGDWSNSELAFPWPSGDTLTGIGAGLDPIRIESGLRLSNLQLPTVNLCPNRFIKLSPILKLNTALRQALLEDPRNYQLRYIPADKQDELITPESVSEVMNAARMSFNDEVVRCIVEQNDMSHTSSNPFIRQSSSTSRRKLFAILVMIGTPEKIYSFIGEGIWDKHLPFQRRPTTNEWEYRDDNGVGDARRVRCFQDETWDQLSIDLFETYQWYLLSPVFDFDNPKLIHYPLHRKTPLPFIDTFPENGRPIDGGFGEVRRVRIHPAHQNLKSKDLTYAVKRLKSQSMDEFDREVEALKLFRHHGDPHLVKLLATYHDGEHYNLIFPWADGNLSDYWRWNSRPEPSYRRILWIAEQFAGIAQALRKLHYGEFPENSSAQSLVTIPKKGRHGDIKPENILWFPPSDAHSNDQGVLVLSDFGLTRFHRAFSVQRKYNRNLAISLTYRAPEFDLDGEVSPSWDVWTLGCVYLEFLICYLQGWDALEEFSEQRFRCDFATDAGKQDKFFTCEKWTEFGAYRKVPVIRVSNPRQPPTGREYVHLTCRMRNKKIEQLHNHPGCTVFIHDFLGLISKGMIRIRSSKRLDSTVIAQKTQAMLRKCKENPVYCTEPARMTFAKRATNESDKKPIYKRFLFIASFMAKEAIGVEVEQVRPVTARLQYNPNHQY